MNIKTTAVTLSSLFIAFPVFAMDYPQFGGITLNSDTTAAQYIIYFFNLALAIGAFIAVIMVISAGIEWVTSGGNPNKVQSAKGKIVNTLFGVCVLLGCYFILDTINPELTNIKINDLNCENGIVLKVTKTVGGKVEEKCIDFNHSNIEDIIISTKKWNFPEGYLLKVYTYPQINYGGEAKEIDCSSGACSGNIDAATKSIYFVPNSPGIYLYDAVKYGVGVKSYPRFTSTSIADLTQLGSFDNYTKSIQIINPDQSRQPIQYQAVVFDSQNWKGRCAFVAQSVEDVSTGRNPYYTDIVNNISSIIVAKSNLDSSAINKDRGYVTLYTKTNCGKSSTSTEIKSCSIKIDSAASGQIDIEKQCKNTNIDPKTNKEIGFTAGDEVMSFEITGAAGLVLSTAKYGEKKSNTQCQYFNKQSLGGGTCVSIVGTSIFTVGGDTPKSFVVIPDN